MGNDSERRLTETELRDLRRLAGIMVPSSAEHGTPGADDPAIFDDIVSALGRDRDDVCAALSLLREIAEGDFAAIGEAEAEAAAMTLLQRKGREITALGRAVLQCYYRDERVIRSLGLEPGSPFPRGNRVAQGDWSLLDAVRGRPPMWRNAGGEAG